MIKIKQILCRFTGLKIICLLQYLKSKVLKKKIIATSLSVVVLLIVFLFINRNYFVTNRQLKFSYPFQQALFPRDFTSPTFYWNDNSKNANSWKVTIELKASKEKFTALVNKCHWRPEVSMWDSIKILSKNEDILVMVERFNPLHHNILNSTARVSIRISEDEVASPILYRQILLPTALAEANIQYTSFDLIDPSSDKPPHVVLGNFKVCGNCHTITTDGSTIGLDFDAVRRDKGGYFVSKLDSVTTFDKDNYFSWSKLTGKNTFGLLTRLSRDGRYIMVTIKDRVIFERYEDLAYSQLFFPVNGILAVYDTQTKKLWELPGANDPGYVQTNAVWSPDDKYLIFARTKALPYPNKNSKYDSFVSDKDIISNFEKGKKDFKFELYKIPFNEGKGGKAEPIAGASNNGKSNYFPTVSPDGKWIVFCEADNFMMLRPDSRLYIVPFEGGEARKLKCNLPELNSWHDWSPNGKWLVFASKSLSICTDLFLTHIDSEGHASVPVLLDIQKRVNSALNYPMFVNRDPKKPFTMDYKYINTTDIIEALKQRNNKENVYKLLDIYFKQQQLGMPIEYFDLARIYENLGDKKESEKYRKLGEEADKKFSVGF
jgi:hypothetical protein